MCITDSERDPLYAQLIAVKDETGEYKSVLSYDLPSITQRPNGQSRNFPPWKAQPPRWGHPLHRMAARSGSFPPALARYFIEHYSNPNDVVFDPFCGKGTTVLEALLAGRVAYGSDVAPEAFHISRAKISGVTHEEAMQYLDSTTIQPRPTAAVPADVKVYYHPETLGEILALLEILLRDVESSPATRGRQAAYLLGCLIGILHRSSAQALSLSTSHSHGLSPHYVRRYAEKHGLERPRRFVRKCLQDRSAVLLAGQVVPHGRANVYRSLAQRYSFNRSHWLDAKVDLAVTSPPYPGIQTYAWDNWLRLWFLGFDYRDIQKQIPRTWDLQRYGDFTRSWLLELATVLRPGAKGFVVIGDVFKRQSVNGRKSKRRVNGARLVVEAIEALNAQHNQAIYRIDSVIHDTLPSHARYQSTLLKDHNDVWLENGIGSGVRIDRIVCLSRTGYPVCNRRATRA